MGSFHRDLVPQNTRVGNSITFGVTFTGPPLVIVSSSDSRVNVGAQSITTTGFNVEFFEVIDNVDPSQVLDYL